MTRLVRSVGLCALAGAALALPLTASAEGSACTPISATAGGLPGAGGSSTIVLRSPGTYCLTQDLVLGSNPGIQILANDVTIEMNGHELACSACDGAIGIRSESVNHTTLRNGTLRAWPFGIYVHNGSGHLLEGLRIRHSRFRALTLEGVSNTLVRDNFIRGTLTSDASRGLSLSSVVNVTVLNNDIVDPFGFSSDGGYAIHAQGCFSCIFEGNRLSQASPVTGATFGISVDAFSEDTLLVDNRIAGKFDVGIACGGDGKLRDNLTSAGVLTPYQLSGACGDAGHND